MRRLALTISISAAVAAGMALPFGQDAQAGKPGGGGTTAPGGTIVFSLEVQVPIPSTGSVETQYPLYATNVSGTAWRSLGLVSQASASLGGIYRVKTSYTRSAVEVAGKLWVIGKRIWYSDANGNWYEDAGEQTAWAVIAACEDGTDVELATGDASNVSDVNVSLNAYFAFLPDGDRIRGRTRSTYGADWGIWDAAISWDSSGVPSIAPTDGQAFVLVLPESEVSGLALDLSPDADRVVGQDQTASTLWIRTRTAGGVWSSPRTLVAGVTSIAYPKLSPDGTKVLYRGSDALRIVNADGTGDVAVFDNSNGGSITYPSGVWSPDGANLAVVRTRRTTGSVSSTLNWAPAKAKSTATQIGTWNCAGVSAWLP